VNRDVLLCDFTLDCERLAHGQVVFGGEQEEVAVGLCDEREQKRLNVGAEVTAGAGRAADPAIHTVVRLALHRGVGTVNGRKQNVAVRVRRALWDALVWGVVCAG
jgi:hypothetical protein